MWTGLILFGIGTTVGSSEHGNGPSCSLIDLAWVAERLLKT
jgi:hypothetical protein